MIGRMNDHHESVLLKQELRARIRESRRERGPEGAQADSSRFAEHLIALTREHDASIVAAYLSTPDEPDTRAYLDWAREHGVRVLLPISRTDGLMDLAEFSEDEIEGYFGIPEPGGEVLAPNAIEDADVIFLPASAVDRSGMRMGWGRGYFDKLLGSMETLPPTYAVIYDDELLDDVPSEPHDHPVLGVITPSGIHRIETD